MISGGTGMRTLVNATLVLVSAAAVALTVPSAAAAAPADPPPWKWSEPIALVDMYGASQGKIPGHPGNWHAMEVRVEGDDDGVQGGTTDWQCPPGAEPGHEDGNPCEILAVWSMGDDAGITITWSPRIRQLRARGTVQLENNETGAFRMARVNAVYRADGRYTRTDSMSSEQWPHNTVYQTRMIERVRIGATAGGRLGWVRLDPSETTVWQEQIVVRRSAQRKIHTEGDGA